MNPLSLIAAGESAVGPTLAVIVGAGMFAQWLAWRTQLPSIIALLIAGLVLGPVTGVLDPDDLLGDTLFPIVSLAVALILFEGGLDLPPRELRNTGTAVRRLITIGAVITFVVGWYSARTIFEISNEAAIVLGAVLVVTGPTVVGPLLRFVRPAGTTGPILRAEGVLIDPIGATGALVAFELVLADEAGEAVLSLLGTVGLTLLAGIGFGLAAAFVLDQALQRFLIPDQLAVPVTFAFVVASFVAANEIQEESGLLAVTVLGIYLARRDSSTIRQVLEFNESLRTLLISALFILLAARIEADALRDVLVPSLLFLAVLVLIARPLTVLVSTVRTSLTWRERAFLTTMAPRGIVAAAVSAIFALRLEEEGVADSEKIVPIVFLVIIGTIVVYGFLAGPAARLLGLAEAQADGVLIAGSHSIGRGLALELKERDVKTLLIDTDPYNVTRAIAGGLTARRMSVLAEEATHDLDLRGIGRMLALTSNDEVNALATGRFARAFGRREVFQLAPGKRRSGQSAVPDEYLGRIIGIDGLTYATLDERSRQGWKVVGAPAGPTMNTALDEQLFIPLARVTEGRMAFICRNDPLPTEGDVIGLAAPSLQRQIAADKTADEPADAE
ncbi:cation:proton antiporter [Ilumatobacter coccineus]|jgi:NhaP-type Na+/H+ or K+/H+ antiporter|uniref:Putative sodium/proton antiporter n=1 Tax=Ilumatobacter coccineus (strain NBRC 103263 / KCTC 29153 / YM16-304) TaxID=1313172 RepID=A0A6C7E8H9_ILUCY|nr:sodium:proton antiporter [Ilumatobacter coccineus]BAN03964.1 putative sodium/proton antiporter [Ilumatobacter coccineus YM16-304]